MAEYIERDAVLQIINTVNETGGFARYDDYSALFDEIDTMPTADVQPVDRWISVDEKLPEDFGDCLVWYRCDTAFGKSESWGIAACSRGEWYTKHLHGDNIVVLYWHSMPEPPKEG